MQLNIDRKCYVVSLVKQNDIYKMFAYIRTCRPTYSDPQNYNYDLQLLPVI